jgi:hypothetical protein
MKNINFFKKYKLFKIFKKSLNSNKVELEMNYGIRIDSAYRIYTVLNIPEELIGEAYSLRKSDIDRISESYIKEYSKNLNVVIAQHAEDLNLTNKGCINEGKVSLELGVRGIPNIIQ